MQSCHSLQSLSYAELSFLAVFLPCRVVIPCSLSPMRSCHSLQSLSHAELSFLAVSLLCRVVVPCSLSPMQSCRSLQSLSHAELSLLAVSQSLLMPKGSLITVDYVKNFGKKFNSEICSTFQGRLLRWGLMGSI